jgi:hypothetical protein
MSDNTELNEIFVYVTKGNFDYHVIWFRFIQVKRSHNMYISKHDWTICRAIYNRFSLIRYRFKRFSRYSDIPSTPRYFLYIKIVFLPILVITLTILKISLYNNISKIHYNWIKEDFTRFLLFTYFSISSKRIYYLIL